MICLRYFLEEGEDGSEEEEEYIFFILRVDIFLVTIFHKVLSEGGVGFDPSPAPPPLATLIIRAAHGTADVMFVTW